MTWCLSYCRSDAYKRITKTLENLMTISCKHPQAPSVPQMPGPPPAPDPNQMSNAEAEQYVSLFGSPREDVSWFQPRDSSHSRSPCLFLYLSYQGVNPILLVPSAYDMVSTSQP